jgi:hypothetical protein
VDVKLRQSAYQGRWLTSFGIRTGQPKRVNDRPQVFFPSAGVVARAAAV